MYNTTLSQKYVKDMGLCKKKMHTQRRYATCLGMSKKREIAPDPKRKKRKESDGAYKGVHTPSTKKISTHLHILIEVYDLFLLWIRSLT